MFQKSFESLKKAQSEMDSFARKSESKLYPIIDQAISDKKDLPTLMALVCSLPVEESRYKYLEITSKISVRLALKEAFDDSFYTDEFDEIEKTLDMEKYLHIELAMNELNKLVQAGKFNEAQLLTNDPFIEDSVKISMKEYLLKY